MDMQEHRRRRKRNKIEIYDRSGFGRHAPESHEPKRSDPEHLAMGYDVEKHADYPSKPGYAGGPSFGSKGGGFSRVDRLKGHEGGTTMPKSSRVLKATIAPAGREHASAKMPGEPSYAPFSNQAKALEDYSEQGHEGMVGPTRLAEYGHNTQVSEGPAVDSLQQPRAPHVQPPSQPSEGQIHKRRVRRKRSHYEQAFAGGPGPRIAGAPGTVQSHFKKATGNVGHGFYGDGSPAEA